MYFEFGLDLSPYVYLRIFTSFLYASSAAQCHLCSHFCYYSLTFTLNYYIFKHVLYSCNSYGHFRFLVYFHILKQFFHILCFFLFLVLGPNFGTLLLLFFCIFHHFLSLFVVFGPSPPVFFS